MYRSGHLTGTGLVRQEQVSLNDSQQPLWSISRFEDLQSIQRCQRDFGKFGHGDKTYERADGTRRQPALAVVGDTMVRPVEAILPVHCPIDGSPLASFAIATEFDVQMAIASANTRIPGAVHVPPPSEAKSYASSAKSFAGTKPTCVLVMLGSGRSSMSRGESRR